MNSWNINFRKVPFGRITICLILGILMQNVLECDVNSILFFLIGTFLILWIVYFLGKKFLLINRGFFGVSSFFVLLSGYMISYSFNDHTYLQEIESQITQAEVFYGQVIDKSKKGDAEKYTIQVDSLQVDSFCIHGSFHILVQRTSQSLRIGDVIKFKGNARPLANPSHSLDFNYKKFLERKRIYYQMYNASIVLINRTKSTMMQSWQMMYLNEMESSSLHADSKAVLKAMLAGDKSSLGEITDIFRRTGTSHVLAISGLHVGIISLLIHFLCGFIHKQMKWMRPMLVIIGVWLFCLLSGCYPSTVRACTMVSLYCIGLLLNRKSFGLNLCCIAAFFMLCYNPNLIYDIGFQFSFLAVLGILLFFQPIYRALLFRGILDRLWQMTVLSLSAQVFILPLSIYYFHSFPVYFIVTSWVAVPMTFLIVIIGLSYVIAGLMGIKFDIVAGVIDVLVEWLIQFLHYFSNVPFATLSDLWPSIIELIVYYMFFGSMLYFINKRSKKSMVFAFTIFCVLLGAFVVNNEFKQREKLVIYKSSNHRVMDYVNQGRIIRFYDKNIDTKKLKYITKNTTSFYKADSIFPVPLDIENNHQIRIKDQNILFYNTPMKDELTEPVTLVLSKRLDYVSQDSGIPRVFTVKKSSLHESFPNFEQTIYLNQ